MKIFIMTDMEGISGIRCAEDCQPDKPQYVEGKKLLAGDVNAAVCGAIEGGAKEIFVCDGHGTGNNFLVEAMDARARYCAAGGLRRIFGILDSTFSGYFAVGYHAMAGTLNAFLDHTQSTQTIFEYSINGKACGELAQLALIAGSLNVAPLLVTGDQAACEEALGLTPGIETVAVKQAYGNERVDCIHPSLARELIRAAARRAVSLKGKVKPYSIPGPYAVRLTYQRTKLADILWSSHPWVTRIDARTLEFVTEDPSKILFVM